MIEPEYKVKLLATPAFDITYSLTRFAPVIKAANSPAKKTKKKKTDISTLNTKKQEAEVAGASRVLVPKVTRR